MEGWDREVDGKGMENTNEMPNAGNTPMGIREKGFGQDFWRG